MARLFARSVPQACNHRHELCMSVHLSGKTPQQWGARCHQCCGATKVRVHQFATSPIRPGVSPRRSSRLCSRVRPSHVCARQGCFRIVPPDLVSWDRSNAACRRQCSTSEASSMASRRSSSLEHRELQGRDCHGEDLRALARGHHLEIQISDLRRCAFRYCSADFLHTCNACM